MRFRKFSPLFWKDEKIIDLSKEEKLIAAYCLTSHQTNRIGLFNFSTGQAAQDLDFEKKKFDVMFKRILKVLSWKFDERFQVLYLPTWWKYNSPESPSTLTGYIKDIHDIPETPLKHEFSKNTTYLSDTLTHTLPDTSPTGPPIPPPIPPPVLETETETEIETETETYTSPLPQEAVAVCEKLKANILELNPKARLPPSWDKGPGKTWVNEADKLIRLDKRDPVEIHKVLDWVKSSDFWSGNILSTSKLRKQFDQLHIKMNGRQKKNTVESAFTLDDAKSMGLISEDYVDG